MITNQLDTVINQQRILKELAKNLNIQVVTENTSIKKIADTFEVELLNYADAANKNLSNSFISTMDESILETVAAEYGIYRKFYNTLTLNREDKAVELLVNRDYLLNESLTKFKAFSKDDIIYVDSNITVTTLDDLYFDNISSSVYPKVRVTLNSNTPFLMNEGSVYEVKPTVQTTVLFAPVFDLIFNYPFGLAVTTESLEDFRARLYESTYLSNFRNNSILPLIVKEVPFITHIETEDMITGSQIKTLYPYTDKLVQDGNDPSLSDFIIPVTVANLDKRLDYNHVKVYEPAPLRIIVELEQTTSTTKALLDQILQNYNAENYKQKTFSLVDLKEYIVRNTIDLVEEDIKVVFINPFFSEEGIEATDIDVPIGRFIYTSGRIKNE